MPAVSKIQQQAAGAELARRKAGKKSKLFKSMSVDELKKFASTPRKELPLRIMQSRRGRYAA